MLTVYQAVFDRIKQSWLAATSRIPESNYFNVVTVPGMCVLVSAKFPFSWKNFKNAASWVDRRKEFYRGKRGAATPHGGQTSNLPPKQVKLSSDATGTNQTTRTDAAAQVGTSSLASTTSVAPAYATRSHAATAQGVAQSAELVGGAATTGSVSVRGRAAQTRPARSPTRANESLESGELQPTPPIQQEVSQSQPGPLQVVSLPRSPCTKSKGPGNNLDPSKQ